MRSASPTAYRIAIGPLSWVGPCSACTIGRRQGPDRAGKAWMKAPPFSYVRAASIADLFAKWEASDPDARLLAGGQSLLASLAFRLSEPSTLIDVTRVPELGGIAAVGGRVRVGALTTHAELGGNELVRQQVPLLAEAVPLIAHPAIRNRGTIGGSLAYADPAAELPACCVALDAVILARSAGGERAIPAAQFFTGLYMTALGEKELIADRKSTRLNS